MDFCFPYSSFPSVFFMPFYLHFFKTLITHIILLPSTRMRHHFFCHWELQISSELALEKMGGDRSGRRWGDRLTNMFELALTHSGRESTLGNQRDFRGQIAALQSRKWRFVLEQHAVPAPFQSGWGFMKEAAARETFTCVPPSLQF